MHKGPPAASPVWIAPLLLAANLATAAARDEGELAFNGGDFARAAALFEQAITEGDKGNATRYNLAVSYFRQGEINKANANFRALFDAGSRSADVLYSLAVTEKLLGHTAAAVQLFSTVAIDESELSDEALAQLEELGVDPVVTTVAATNSRLSSSLQVATGYNDAIVEVEDGKLTRSRDRYAESYGALTWQRPFDNTHGIDLNLSLYDNRYAETEGQDFSLASVGLQQTLPAFGHQVFWTFDADASQLDDHGFQKSGNVGAGIEDRNATSTWRLSYRYRKSFSLGEAFDPYAGEHHRVQGDYSFRPLPRHQLTVRAYHELIEREPVSNSQSTLDLSRALQRVDIAWAYQLNAASLLSAGINYGRMRAPDYQRFVDGAELRREEETFGFTLTLRRNFTRNLALVATYNRNDNESSLSDFTYDQSVYEIGFAWTPSLL